MPLIIYRAYVQYNIVQGPSINSEGTNLEQFLQDVVCVATDILVGKVSKEEQV